jgi:probable rRNA maturation factor
VSTLEDSLDLTLRIRVSRATAARPDRRRLREVALAALGGEGMTGRATLSLHLVDDAEIARLNRRHRGIDRPTDVLSFSLVDRRVEQSFVLPPGEVRELGDVVISFPRVVSQAAEYGHSVERELAYLMVHGLLHVLGYDHEVESEQLDMRAREEAALAQVGLTR